MLHYVCIADIKISRQMRICGFNFYCYSLVVYYLVPRIREDLSLSQYRCGNLDIAQFLRLINPIKVLYISKGRAALQSDGTVGTMQRIRRNICVVRGENF